MPVARQPVFTPMPPIRKRVRHTSLATHRLGDAPLGRRTAWATHRLGDAPLGRRTAWATHRLGDAPLGRRTAWATHRLGDAPLGRRTAWATHRLGDAPLGRRTAWATHRLILLYNPNPNRQGAFSARRRVPDYGSATRMQAIRIRKNRLYPSGILAGAAGLEPATYGFGDRRSTD